MQNLPFLDLPGPDFLNVLRRRRHRRAGADGAPVIHFADHTDRRPPPVPENPDAIEVAFLQGGVNQVIRTLVYDLVQRGYADARQGRPHRADQQDAAARRTRRRGKLCAETDRGEAESA